MALDALFGNTMTMVQRAMDVRSTHHNRLVSNTVNIDTPGYRPFDALLDAQLARLADPGTPTALARTHPAHLDTATSTGADSNHVDARRGPDSVFGRRVDRNEVDLERNMAELQENQLVYSTLAQVLSRKFRSLKDAIKGGM